jgi:hypothetical protein
MNDSCLAAVKEACRPVGIASDLPDQLLRRLILG